MTSIQAIARYYGSVLARLNVENVTVHVEATGDGIEPISMLLDAATSRKRDKAVSRLTSTKGKDHTGDAIHDMIMDACCKAAASCDLEAGTIAAVAIEANGGIYVDRVSDARRLMGPSGADSPRPFGRIFTCPPDVNVRNYAMMVEAYAGIGVKWIIIDIESGSAAFKFGGPIEVSEDDARGVINSYADAVQSFINEFTLSAKLTCSMGLAGIPWEACEIRYEIETGLALIGPKAGGGTFVKVASMSSTLDPSKLTPSAALWAHAALDAIKRRDEDGLRQAGEAFARESGADASDVVRYAIGAEQVGTSAAQ